MTKKEKEKQKIIYDACTTGSGADAMRKAIQDMVLCTPYSLPTIARLGRGSAVAPNDKELDERCLRDGLSRKDAYSQLVEENLAKLRNDLI